MNDELLVLDAAVPMLEAPGVMAPLGEVALEDVVEEIRSHAPLVTLVAEDDEDPSERARGGDDRAIFAGLLFP